MDKSIKKKKIVGTINNTPYKYKHIYTRRYCTFTRFRITYLYSTKEILATFFIVSKVQILSTSFSNETIRQSTNLRK